MSSLLRHLVIPIVAVALAAPALAVGCSSSNGSSADSDDDDDGGSSGPGGLGSGTGNEEDLCESLCDCEGCTDREEDDCVDGWELAARDADEEGCGEIHDDYQRCLRNDADCSDGVLDLDDCTDETAALAECLSGASDDDGSDDDGSDDDGSDDGGTDDGTDGSSDDDDDGSSDDDDDGSSDDDDGSDDDGGSDDCQTGCEDLGFASGTPDGDSCICDGPTDAACFSGVNGYCACNEAAGAPCSDAEFFNAYVACFQDSDGAREQLLCVNDYIDGDTVDCEGATACFE